MSLLEVSQLRKSYDGKAAVDGLSFSVEEGQVFGLLGPNGAGKSTTMSMLGGLLPPDSGTITLAGEPFEPRNLKMRPLLGVVPQDLAVYTDLTAFENLRFFGRLYGLQGQQLQDRIDFALDQTGLRENADSLVKTFSGGMKRRLNFGVAVLHQPRLLILDEPTVGVDPQSRSHLMECVRQLSAGGMSVIYASHYMEEVEAICQRVAIIDHGRMLACDGLGELLSRVHSDLSLRVSRCPPDLGHRLRGLAEVSSSAEANETVVTLAAEEEQGKANFTRRLARVLDVLSQQNVPLTSVEAKESNLERLFLELTGHRLRD